AVESPHRDHRAAALDGLPEHGRLVLVHAASEQAPPDSCILDASRALALQARFVEDADVIAMKATGLQGSDRRLCMLRRIVNCYDRFVCHVQPPSPDLSPTDDKRKYDQGGLVGLPFRRLLLRRDALDDRFLAAQRDVLPVLLG